MKITQYGEILSQEQVAAKIREVAIEIGNERNLLQPTKISAAQADSDYRRLKSIALLSAETELLKRGYSKVTESMREAYMIEACEDARLLAKIEEGKAFATQQRLQALYHELMAYQSLLKELQSERRFTNAEDSYKVSSAKAMEDYRGSLAKAMEQVEEGDWDYDPFLDSDMP